MLSKLCVSVGDQLEGSNKAQQDIAGYRNGCDQAQKESSVADAPSAHHLPDRPNQREQVSYQKK